jgi:hypothetical protein
VYACLTISVSVSCLTVSCRFNDFLFPGLDGFIVLSLVSVSCLKVHACLTEFCQCFLPEGACLPYGVFSCKCFLPDGERLPYNSSCKCFLPEGARLPDGVFFCILFVFCRFTDFILSMFVLLAILHCLKFNQHADHPVVRTVTWCRAVVIYLNTHWRPPQICLSIPLADRRVADRSCLKVNACLTEFLFAHMGTI